MKHLLAHYANKYGRENVECSGDKLRAYRDDKLVLSLSVDGAGALRDEGHELGLEDRHDMDPIPREARIYKMVNGGLSRDEKADEREKLAPKYKRKGRIAGMTELAAEGYKFGPKGDTLEEPAKSE